MNGQTAADDVPKDSQDRLLRNHKSKKLLLNMEIFKSEKGWFMIKEVRPQFFSLDLPIRTT